MTVQEIVLRVLSSAKGLAHAVVAVGVVTIVALVLLLLLGRGGVWVTEKRFRWLGLFIGLGGRGSFALACSWLKYLFLLVFLISFQKLDIPHYFAFLMVGVGYVLACRGGKRMLSSAAWLSLELIGILSANLVCSYIRDTGGSVGFFLVYVMMSLFLGLFGCYLFLLELSDISAGRSMDLERGWKLAQDGEEE